MFGNCRETVSILYALIFGADGACVMFSITSILTAFAAFIVLVILAQFVARRLWARLTKPSVTQPEPESEPEPETFVQPADDHPYRDDPNYRDSAIRSTRR